MPGGRAPVRLLLTGDVMTGRGVDQIQRHPSRPALHEGYVKDARDYVKLAEKKNGTIPRRVAPAYVWGEAWSAVRRLQPAYRIVNLETAVTTSDDAWPDKAVHYRMHPRNVACLGAFGIDVAVLANNHALDWEHEGLAESLDVLRAAGIRTAGAGRDLEQAWAPAILPLGAGGRLLVFGLASPTAGAPAAWAAAAGRPGVNYLPDLSEQSAARLAAHVRARRRPGDVVVVSVHWGGNWGYAVPEAQRRFARALVDGRAADLVHGHSSHHPKGCEVYRERLLLYGCGDFLHDYEGIPGHEAYRNDLVLGWLPSLDPGTGRLTAMRLVPFQVRRLRLSRPALSDARWLRERMHRECSPRGVRIQALDGDPDLGLRASWDRGPQGTR